MQSITGNESANARTTGIKPACVFVMWAEEYAGQRDVTHNGRKMTVYRTFERPDGKIELYAEKRAGKFNG